MDGVGRGKLAVDAVEDIKLVALVVEDGELGRIEEAAGVQAVELDEVAPVLAAVAEVDGGGGGAEGPVGRGDGAGGLGDALAGAGGDDDDDAGLAAELGRRRAVDDLQRLDGVGWELVGEDLALLVGDGLAVDGEGVGGVVAEAVEEAVGVGRDAGRGERDQRAEGGGLALQRQLLEEVAVDVGVADGIVLDQVAGRRW